jgi:hypothetical protein
MKNLIFSVVGMALISIFTGCAFNRKMSFGNKKIEGDFTGYKPMSLTFHDQRIGVLNGKDKPSLCGHLYSGTQIPYNMQTESGKPLAEEFTTSVTGSLTNKSIKAMPLTVPHQMDFSEILARFQTTGMDRLVYIKMNEWIVNGRPKFSTILYEVRYHFDLVVYDREGKELARNQAHDTWENEEATLAVSLKRMQAYADTVFVQEIRKLLTADQIKASLK